jgi:hypothetical protein
VGYRPIFEARGRSAKSWELGRRLPAAAGVLRPFVDHVRSIFDGLELHRVDAACALALSLFAAVLAFWTVDQFKQSGTVPRFYQEEFAPAAMFACGRGLRNADSTRGDPALSDFLLQRRATVACDDLATVPPLPRDTFQRISLYLELAVGLVWRAVGLSWNVVVWLNALLAGFFAATVYGVMRLGMRRLPAAILSAVVITSPLHLSYLPQLRDYSKAPFLLALVLLMGVAVKWPLSRRRLSWLAAVGGVVGGVGFGFRTDILLSIGPLVAVLLVFRAGRPGVRWRARFFEGAMASAVFVTSFTLTALPVIRGYAGGGNVGHVMLLGLSSPFNPGLGVEAKHYEVSGHYDDMFQETVVRSYAGRVEGNTHLFSMGSDEYDRETSRYLMSVIRTFPADVAVRAVGSVARIFQVPFSPGYSRATGWMASRAVRRIYERRADVLDRLPWLGLVASAALVAGMAACRLRPAVFLLLLVAFLAGGAAIQFDPRHFFYLEFMAWWTIGVMVDRAVTAAWARPSVIGDGRWRDREWLMHAGWRLATSATLVVLCGLGTTLVLRATRHYQQRELNRLFDQALSSAGPPLNVAQLPADTERVTLVPDLPELALSGALRSANSIGTAYLLVDINPQRCDALNLFALAKYDTIPGLDFTAPVSVSLADPQAESSVKILLPVYSALYAGDRRSGFRGIELARSHASCIAAIRRVGHLESLPVLVTAILGADWRTAAHYQTLRGVEDRDDGSPFNVQVYLTQSTLEVRRSWSSHPAFDPWTGAVATSRAVAPTASGAVVDGTPESGDAYLLQYAERRIPRGTCAFASGELTAGGLTFGILRNGLWDQTANVLDLGRFVAAGCAREDGDYSLVLANNNPTGGVTRARLAKIGWNAPGNDRVGR